jgi:hypothetical protein
MTRRRTSPTDRGGRRRGFRRWGCYLLLVPLALPLACARHRVAVLPAAYTCYRDSSFEQQAVRRVVLMPTENETTHGEAGRRFRESLAAELRAQGLFEVIAPPEGVFGECPLHTVAGGAIPPQLLLDMALQFNADGVLFSCLTAYHPYAPPRIGATVHLVTTREAATLVSVDGLWDARNEAITESAQDFAEHLALPGGTSGPDTILHAPTYFEKFVAWQIACAFAGPTPGAGAPAETGSDVESQNPGAPIPAARERRLLSRMKTAFGR